MGANPGQQNRKAKGLVDVIIGSRVKSGNDVGFGIVRGQHDDRLVEPLGAQFLDGVAPVAVWQADIHDDQIDRPFSDGFQGFSGVSGLDWDKIVVNAQLFGKGNPQERVIIDDQNPTHLRHG